MRVKPVCLQQKVIQVPKCASWREFCVNGAPIAAPDNPTEIPLTVTTFRIEPTIQPYKYTSN